jgi:hypothetical protein
MAGETEALLEEHSTDGTVLTTSYQVSYFVEVHPDLELWFGILVIEHQKMNEDYGLQIRQAKVY